MSQNKVVDAIVEKMNSVIKQQKEAYANKVVLAKHEFLNAIYEIERAVALVKKTYITPPKPKKEED